jgi:hypothetical protein
MAQVQQTVRLMWISAFGQLGDDVLYAIVLDVFHEQLVTYENAIDVTQKRFVHLLHRVFSFYLFLLLGSDRLSGTGLNRISYRFLLATGSNHFSDTDSPLSVWWGPIYRLGEKLCRSL